MNRTGAHAPEANGLILKSINLTSRSKLLCARSSQKMVSVPTARNANLLTVFMNSDARTMTTNIKLGHAMLFSKKVTVVMDLDATFPIMLKTKYIKLN